MVVLDNKSKKLGFTVGLTYLSSNSGYFVFLSMLAVILKYNHSANFVGLAMASFTVSVRGGSLVLRKYLSGKQIKKSIILSLVIIVITILLQIVLYKTLLQIPLLIICGLAISANTMMLRVFISSEVSEVKLRQILYSIIQIAVNIAAGMGTLLGNFLFHFNIIYLYIGVALSYVVCIFVIAYLLPATSAIPHKYTSDHTVLNFKDFMAAVLSRQIFPTFLIVCAGSMCIAQLFSAFSFLIRRETQSLIIISLFYVVNSVLIVLFQLLITKLVNNSAKGNFFFLCFSLLLFALSFMVMSLTHIVFLFIGITIFSCAEMLYTPTSYNVFEGTRTKFTQIDLYNFRQLGAVLGESLGVFVAGSIYLKLSWAHQGQYWLTLSVALVIIACTVFIFTKKSTSKSVEAGG